MKMSRTLIVHALIFYLIVNNCFSQTTKIDSLQNLLKTASDTTEVNILRKLGENYRFHDKEKAVQYGLKSLEKSKQIGFVKGESKALYALGVTHGMTDNYAKSLEYLNKCLTLATNQQDHKSLCDVYNSLGIVYKRIGDYPKSQGYYLKSIGLVDSLQLKVNVSSEYINLGVLYDLMGQQDKAVESYEKALETYKGPDRKDKENAILTNLAVMDFNNGNFKAALDKFLQRQQYAEEQNDNMSRCIGHSNIGMCHLKLQQWKPAEEHLLKSLELAKQLSLKNQIVVNYNGLADLMLQQEKFKEAINYSTKSLKSLDISGGYEQKREVHQQAYEIYEAVNQLPKALYHLNQTIAYKDSLMNETKVREIQNLQIQHDVYVKDREIEANQLQLALLNTRVEQNKKRMVYFIIILILLLFSASLLYFRFFGKEKIQRPALREKSIDFPTKRCD
ncbi:MAG: tetratricopeptide repeat protein [Flagellimonas sp.]